MKYVVKELIDKKNVPMFWYKGGAVSTMTLITKVLSGHFPIGPKARKAAQSIPAPSLLHCCQNPTFAASLSGTEVRAKAAALQKGK